MMRTIAYLVAVLTILRQYSMQSAINGCQDSVRRCLYADNNSAVLRTENVGEPLFKDVNGFSQLIRYVYNNNTVRGPITVDRDFLSTVELLYNNEHQLRILLTLLRAGGSPPWLRFMQGYDDCAGRSAVFTCIRGTCREYDLTRLRYVNTIFTENVVGFELRQDPFGVHVIIGALNRYTKAHKAVRVNASHIYMFDAVFNTIKHFLLLHQMGDTPILRRLDTFNGHIKEPYRDKSVTLLRPR